MESRNLSLEEVAHWADRSLRQIETGKNYASIAIHCNQEVFSSQSNEAFIHCRSFSAVVLTLSNFFLICCLFNAEALLSLETWRLFGPYSIEIWTHLSFTNAENAKFHFWGGGGGGGNPGNNGLHQKQNMVKQPIKVSRLYGVSRTWIRRLCASRRTTQKSWSNFHLWGCTMLTIMCCLFCSNTLPNMEVGIAIPPTPWKSRMKKWNSNNYTLQLCKLNLSQVKYLSP